jgi:hypothetical protein
MNHLSCFNELFLFKGGVRAPYPSSRDQAKTPNDASPYLVPTPLAGLKSDQLPLRSRSYDNEERSCSVESVYSQDSGPVTKVTPQDIRPIPTIMVTSGTSSETTANGTDESRRSSEEQREKKDGQVSYVTETTA